MTAPRLLLAAWALVSLLPLLLMLLGGFLPSEVLLGGGDGSWAPDLAAYRRLAAGGRVTGWMTNSLLIAAGAAAGQVFSAAALAYVLAKRRFAGRAALLAGIGLLMMVPGQVLVVPLFVLVTRLGLIDSPWGVLVPALATPFGVFLMYTRMLEVPDELIEAARIDGCGELGIFFRVVFPLVAPAAATLAIFAFVGQWNSFLWPLLVLFQADQYTLPVGLATLQGQNQIEYGLLLAGATLAAAPMVAVFLVFQRAFTRGGLSGAVKG